VQLPQIRCTRQYAVVRVKRIGTEAVASAQTGPKLLA
jgi:hypothetical protein